MSKWSSKTGKSNPLDKKEAPPKQPDFTIGSVNFIKIGTVAVFGVEEEDLINTIAEKLNKVSSMYGCVVHSRMGDEVPEPEHEEVTEGNEWPMQLGHREKTILDKVFCIVYMQGLNENGEACYAYVNVRTDRLDKLHEKMFAGPTFNLPDYSTIVLTGQGAPDFEAREKLQRDYLFGERHTNVRIFPPLADVT